VIFSHMGKIIRRCMTREQCRAARGWLGWSQGELAARAGVAKNTVYLFEAGQRSPTENVLAALRSAIEAEGIRLVFDDTGAPAGIIRRGIRIDLSEVDAGQSGG
jgi:transcriptional regulator with XRE-family HTH domain